MARIRSVKPEFWVDRSFVRKVPDRTTRMLYMALWNLADEHGRLMADVSYLKGHIFPYAEDADLTPDVIDKMLNDLAFAGKVVRYEVDGDPYLFLPTLHRHQRLESAKVASRLPEPPQPGGGGPRGGGRTPSVSGSRANESARGADSSEPGADECAQAVNSGPSLALVQAGPQMGTGAGECARRADESEPDADESSLFYGAGSMEPGTGSLGAARGPESAAHLSLVPSLPADEPPTQAIDDAEPAALFDAAAVAIPPQRKSELAKKTPGSRVKSKTSTPEAFEVTDDLATWAWNAHKIPRHVAVSQTQVFLDNSRAKGNEYKDWTAAWRTWMSRVPIYHPQLLRAGTEGGYSSSQRRPTVEQRVFGTLQAAEELAMEVGEIPPAPGFSRTPFTQLPSGGFAS